jgi:hypothetical protein
MMMRKSDIELRDWYAGLAMQVILTNGLKDNDLHGEDFMGQSAENAFMMAQVMMTQRQYEDMDRGE